ncbi:MAG: outer membrane protein assembly factor BamD [Bdellovibrionales bacterium]|nr:outer membrane protein assembly factor BamD [Bdellovibrionales bacterium]
MNRKSLALVFTMIALILIGCSSTPEIDSSSAEGAYKLGEIYRKDERYQDSIAQFEVVKNKFPYSRLATMAELQIADINYEREAYIEAQNAYQIFKELHPGHEKIDYVTYRLALSFFMQLPDSIDRDLTLAEQAILYFDEVIHSYPTSEYVAPAQEKKTETLKKLAQKELYIAHFYFIREMFDSALGRYEDLLRKYPKLGFDEESLYGAILSSAHVKDLRKRDFYFEKLKKNHPDSKWTRQAQQELADGVE